MSTTGSLTCPLDNCLAVCSREIQSVWAILNEKKKKKYVVIDEIFYFVIFELPPFSFCRVYLGDLLFTQLSEILIPFNPVVTITIFISLDNMDLSS